MAKAEKGGGKLGRSETVTIRLDPKMNYLAELAARSQRRTKSSLFEAALSEALNVVLVDARPHAQNKSTIAKIAETIWHVDEFERLRRLVQFAPHLMTYEEQKIWAVIEKNGAFWHGKWSPLDEGREYFYFTPEPSNLFVWQVERCWDEIKRVASGEARSDILPDAPSVRSRDQDAQNDSGTRLLTE